jgi:ribosome biogenesis GTPase A
MGRGSRGRARDQWAYLKNMIHGADVIVEVLDARDIEATRLGVAERWTGSKRLLVVANKTDLLPEGMELPRLQNKGIAMSAREGGEAGRQLLMKAILGRTEARPAKALFIGYPNVGKSSLINLLAHRKAALVSPVAGTTKNIQWVRVSEELIVSDYRGMFPRSETEGELVRKGAVKLSGNRERFAYEFAARALGNRVLRDWLEKRYDLKLGAAKSAEDVLRLIALRRGWIIKGGEPNIEEASRHLLRAMMEAPEI